MTADVPAPRFPTTVSTGRLLLRRFSAADLPEYHQVMSQDAVGEQLPKGRGYTLQETESLLTFWIEHWSTHGFGPWAVALEAGGELAGHCGVRQLEDGQVELLYALGSEHWSHGYATEAGRAATAAASAALDVDVLVGYVKPGNARSRRVMDSCGFAPVGFVQKWGLDLMKYQRPA